MENGHLPGVMASALHAANTPACLTCFGSVQDEVDVCREAAAALLSVWTDPKMLGASGALTFDAWELLIRTGVNPAAMSAPQAALTLSKVGLLDLQGSFCAKRQRS